MRLYFKWAALHLNSERLHRALPVHGYICGIKYRDRLVRRADNLVLIADIIFKHLEVEVPNYEKIRRKYNWWTIDKAERKMCNWRLNYHEYLDDTGRFKDASSR